MGGWWAVEDFYKVANKNGENVFACRSFNFGPGVYELMTAI